MRVGFHTFGCKLNQYETEALASPLRSQGFSVAGAREEADLYIVNTCTVTSRADHKARALIRALAREHPSALLVVTGCAAQLEAESLGALAPNVLVVPQSEKAVLLDLPRFLGEARAGQAGAGSGGRWQRGARSIGPVRFQGCSADISHPRISQDPGRLRLVVRLLQGSTGQGALGEPRAR